MLSVFAVRKSALESMKRKLDESRTHEFVTDS
jgi:hypothetical protein